MEKLWFCIFIIPCDFYVYPHNLISLAFKGFTLGYIFPYPLAFLLLFLLPPPPPLSSSSSIFFFPSFFLFFVLNVFPPKASSFIFHISVFRSLFFVCLFETCIFSLVCKKTNVHYKDGKKIKSSGTKDIHTPQGTVVFKQKARLQERRVSLISGQSMTLPLRFSFLITKMKGLTWWSSGHSQHYKWLSDWT